MFSDNRWAQCRLWSKPSTWNLRPSIGAYQYGAPAWRAGADDATSGVLLARVGDGSFTVPVGGSVATPLTATMTEEQTLIQTKTMTDFATVTDQVTMTEISTVVKPTTYVSVWVKTSIIDQVSETELEISRVESD